VPKNDIVGAVSGTTVRATGIADPAFLIDAASAQRARSNQIALEKFLWRSLDNSPGLLSKSFELRFSSYCEGQEFLNASDYPDRKEFDEFDKNSLHIGVIHGQTDIMTATARIVVTEASKLESSLPMYSHCTIDKKYQDFLSEVGHVGEISRFVMSREAIDHISGLDGGAKRGTAAAEAASKFQHSLPAILTLYKSIYQSCRLNGIPVLVAAMEQSLRRLVSRFSFPFHQIGPEVDYFGPVAPFLLDLDELDDVLFDEAPWLLTEFYRGLDGPSFQTAWYAKNAEKSAPAHAEGQFGLVSAAA
jgi:N-acyl amino acid synthase of PEP-CTERM/exosortase system